MVTLYVIVGILAIEIGILAYLNTRATHMSTIIKELAIREDRPGVLTTAKDQLRVLTDWVVFVKAVFLTSLGFGALILVTQVAISSLVVVKDGEVVSGTDFFGLPYYYTEPGIWFKGFSTPVVWPKTVLLSTTQRVQDSTDRVTLAALISLPQGYGQGLRMLRSSPDFDSFSTQVLEPALRSAALPLHLVEEPELLKSLNDYEELVREDFEVAVAEYGVTVISVEFVQYDSSVGYTYHYTN